MKKEEGITREKLDDIVTAIESASERFANWLLDNATTVQPNFVGYWRYKKDGKLYTTSTIYKKFKTDIAPITQKNELVKADVSNSYCELPEELEDKDCTILKDCTGCKFYRPQYDC